MYYVDIVEPPLVIAARAARRSCFVLLLLAFNMACWWAFLSGLGLLALQVNALLGISVDNWFLRPSGASPEYWKLGANALLQLLIPVVAVEFAHHGPWIYRAVRSQFPGTATAVSQEVSSDAAETSPLHSPDATKAQPK